MSNPSANKRQKERARKDRQLEKQQKKDQRKKERADRPPGSPEEMSFSEDEAPAAPRPAAECAEGVVAPASES